MIWSIIQGKWLLLSLVFKKPKNRQLSRRDRLFSYKGFWSDLRVYSSLVIKHSNIVIDNNRYLNYQRIYSQVKSRILKLRVLLKISIKTQNKNRDRFQSIYQLKYKISNKWYLSNKKILIYIINRRLMNKQNNSNPNRISY